MDRFTILSQRTCGLLRYMDCGLAGAKLQEFTPDGLRQVELDADELRAFLRALPKETLLDAVGTNLFYGLDDLPRVTNGCGPILATPTPRPLALVQDAGVRCMNCGDPETERYGMVRLTCGHVLCEFCAKDGCMLDEPNPGLADEEDVEMTEALDEWERLHGQA